MELKETSAGLRKLGILFNKHLTNEMIEIYHEYLKDLDYNNFKIAVEDFILNSYKFPTIKELRDSSIPQEKIKRPR